MSKKNKENKKNISKNNPNRETDKQHQENCK